MAMTMYIDPKVTRRLILVIVPTGSQISWHGDVPIIYTHYTVHVLILASLAIGVETSEGSVDSEDP